MMKKRMTIASAIVLTCLLFSGCATKDMEKSSTESVIRTEKDGINVDKDNKEKKAAELPDGQYSVDFDTDSSMFHVNEACNGKGTLTVENGQMTVHISLVSKNIQNLYQGLAEDAVKEGAELLNPTKDKVTYSDGFTEEVYGFDVPVPVINQEFDLALIGTKGKWYDHKVIVSNPEPVKKTQANDDHLEDGTYTVDITFEGGSGKAKILSPVTLTVEDGTMVATLQWDSPNYDYMIVDGEKYLPTNTEGDSVFEIPVSMFEQPIHVIGDTVAMSKPHEIEYTFTLHSDTIQVVE